MVVKPKVRGFICTTAHPAGCKEHVRQQIEHARKHPVARGPKRALILGASTGYGLASRITAAFGCGAHNIGVFFEKPSSGMKTASAGWYNNLAFESFSKEQGLPCHSINGDAFSKEIKAETIDAIQTHMPDGKVDLVIYSLAAPRRRDPETGYIYSSVIKPIEGKFHSKTVDVHSGEVAEVIVAPATKEETEETVAVMGGADWLLWMEALNEAGVLAEHTATLAYSYIGPAITHAIYKDGTIGQAKTDLEEKARQIDSLLAPLGGKAFISVNKALVTQASSAIPVVPLYIALLYKTMKREKIHEGCIEQIVRMFERIYPADHAKWEDIPVDSAGRIRMDDWEMRPEIQREVADAWEAVNTDNMPKYADLEGYCDDFYRLFGFHFPNINYEMDVEI